MRNLKFLFILIVSMLFVSCFEEEDLGYPYTVTFSKDGGKKTVVGTESFTDAHILDYKSGDDGEPDESDVQSEIYKWLKIEYTKPYSNELKIIADPNTTSETRELHIELYSGPQYQIVKVKQH